MTVQKAYNLFIRKKSELVVMSCTEYTNCFVFHAVPSDLAEHVKAAQALNSLYAVDKITGSVRSFNPMEVSPLDHKKSKRITIYDYK